MSIPPLDLSSPLARAHGGPAGSGVIRTLPHDFVVDEENALQPSGDGEHVLLRVEKKGENTDFVARQLARFAKVAARDVSYAGLKDRHGLTTQWFSVHLPGRDDPDWHAFGAESYRVLEAVRHNRKLRKGTLTGNSFRLVVRELNADRDVLEQRLHAIAACGVPNYFGPQRFGRGGGNLQRAADLLAGLAKVRDRHKRGLYLSAARSHLFNLVLSQRVASSSWNAGLSGDVFIFDRTNCFFLGEIVDESIERRLAAMEIHPTGPLWGKGRTDVSGSALEIERSVAGEHPDLALGLERFGADMGRRALRLRVDRLTWEFPHPRELHLSFSLAPGAYATALLRELISFNE